MRHIFLTGVTGVLGSSLAPRLLQDPSNVLHVLIRGKNKAHAQERFEELCQYWGEGGPVDFSGRVHVYCGDAAQPEFGLQHLDYEYLLATITHLVHSAASVKLDMTETEAQTCVLAPSQTMLTFALALHARHRLQKFEYISTLGVAGRMPGAVPEMELPPREFHNNYERTKSHSESEVLAAYKNFGLPVTIHRPSMIVGDSQTGRIVHFQGFYFLCGLLTGKRTYGFLPALPRVTFDLVPSDYVSRAVACSLAVGQETSGRIFHLCSGPKYALSYQELVACLRQYYRGQKVTLPRLVYVTPALFLLGIKVFAWLSGDRRLRKAARGVSDYFRHIETSQVFENDATCIFLEKHAVVLEKPDRFIGKIFDYWFKTGRAPGGEMG